MYIIINNYHFQEKKTWLIAKLAAITCTTFKIEELTCCHKDNIFMYVNYMYYILGSRRVSTAAPFHYTQV